MNSPADDVDDRIHRMAIRQLEGILSDPEREELIALLHENKAARTIYLQHMQDTVSLRWLYSGHYDRRVALTLANDGADSMRRLRRRRLTWGVLAVAAGIACVAAIPFVRRDNQGVAGSTAIAAAPAKRSAAIATVRAVSDVQWANGAAPAGYLSGVKIGQEFDFLQGTVELLFHTGAEVKVFGPAKFKVSSGKSILCWRGRVTTVVGHDGKGFTIDTPKARIIDLGTEFGVDISAKGDTQVVVFQGSVDLTKQDGAADSTASINPEKWTRTLEQGDALLLDDTGEAQRVMAVQRGDFFPTSILDAYGRQRREATILDVRDNIRAGESNKCYQIVRGGLREDAPCFVDRSHQWNGPDGVGMPEFLLGADYIMPFNDDKFISDLAVDVTVGRPSTCYVFFDDNMSPPDWLRRDFRDTGMDVGLDGATTIWHKDHATGVGPGESIDFPFSVWSREVLKAGVVRLGGVDPPKENPRSRGFNMYGIAVVPK
jgi:hypothetical protein